VNSEVNSQPNNMTKLQLLECAHRISFSGYAEKRHMYDLVLLE